MEHDELIGRVQNQARLSSRSDAERACRATLETLREQLPEGLADSIAAQLPQGIGEQLRLATVHSGAGTGERSGRADFIARVAERAGVSEPQAAFIARAVIDVLFAATEGGLMAQVSEYLPPDLREYVTPARSPREQDVPGQVAYGQAAYGQGSPRRGHD
jgi:uncharacterized protein (DUF2267 family)